MLWPGIASADIRGRWESARGTPGATVEVTDNGDSRIEFDAHPGAYLLLRGGEVFHVYRLADGAVVAARPEDLRRLLLERRPQPVRNPEAAQSRMVPGPPEMVRGRAGTSYALEGGGYSGNISLLVLSRDESLMPLGRAFAVGLEMGLTYNALMGGFVDPAIIPLFEMMQTGTALRFGSLELIAVTREPIDAARLALPRLLTIEQLRAGAAAPWVPAEPVF